MRCTNMWTVDFPVQGLFLFPKTGNFGGLGPVSKKHVDAGCHGSAIHLLLIAFAGKREAVLLRDFDPGFHVVSVIVHDHTVHIEYDTGLYHFFEAIY